MKRLWIALFALLLVFSAGYTAAADSSPTTPKSFLVSIEGNAMQPTLFDGETVRVSRAAYVEGEPGYGDVVIYHRSEREDYFLARIIALPGDTIEIKDCAVWINDEQLAEAYVDPENNCYTRDMDAITMGDNEYFLLGDNRDRANDSRTTGPVPREQLIGHVRSVIFPLTQMRVVE